MVTSIPVFFLTLLFVLQNVYAADNGIIGFGLSLWQDLCCQACHDSLSSLYLSCTSFDQDEGMSMHNDMAMLGTTSDECYATNTPWLQTMAYCIDQRCNADGYSLERKSKCFSAQAVAGAAEPTFQSSLPATAPTTELPDNAMWLNETNLVNGDTYYATYGSEKEFARSEYIHTRYSYVVPISFALLWLNFALFLILKLTSCF